MPDNHSFLHNNSTIEDQTTFSTIWLWIIFLLSFVIVVGNSIALAVFLRKTFRVKKSNYLLVNLTLADLLVGVSLMGFAIMAYTSPINISTYNSINTKTHIGVVGRVNSFALNASMYSLSFISVERVLAVFWPFQHRLAKRWHYFAAVGLVWTLSSSSIVLLVYFTQPNPQSKEERVKFLLFSYLVVVISLLTVFLSYLSIWIKMKFFTKFRNCRTIQENRKLTKTLFIVTVVSLGTWLPKMITDYMTVLYSNMLSFRFLNSTYYLFFQGLIFSNSFLNLVVYSFRIPEFGRELRKIFCDCR